MRKYESIPINKKYWKTKSVISYLQNTICLLYNVALHVALYDHMFILT